VAKVGADLAWRDRSILLSNLSWSAETGGYAGNAALSWGEEPSPRLELNVTCEEAQWKAPFGLQFAVGDYHEGLAVPLSPLIARGRAVWKVYGPLSAPLISGEILVRDLDFGGVPDLRPLWREVDPKRVAVRGTTNPYLRDCKLQLTVGSGDGATVTGTSGAASVDVKVTGTAGVPEGIGEFRLALRGVAAGSVLEVEPLVLKMLPGQVLPELEIRAQGTAPGGATYRVNASGPLGHPVREYQADAPLTPEIVRGVFEESKSWQKGQ
jgi:hypothetical protein